MSIVSKEQVCNLALSRMGSFGSVENIDIPKNDLDKVFSKWWDLARQEILKILKPNFALKRDSIAVDTTKPAFGYSYRYRKPSDCLAVLGFGEVQKKENVYAVEGDFILTDEYSGDALPLRYVSDITDVTKFSPEFISLMAFVLSYYSNMEITQDVKKQTYFEQMLIPKRSESGALSGQENRPIRISQSKFKKARYVHNPVNHDKK